MILWNFGLNKINLINFFLKISIFIVIFQIVLTSILVPNAQKISRGVLTSSNIDFYESFIKPNKFIDNIKGLTIYADGKDENGNLKNIYLKKETGSGNFQITYAKNGYFEIKSDAKFLILNDGQTINGVNNKFSKFNFETSELNLSQLDTNVIKVNKIQETSTLELINCIERFFNFDLSKRNKPLSGNFIQNCTELNLDNIFKELYKRFIIPIYIPVLIIMSLCLILYSKEKINFTKFRLTIFLIGFLTIVLSETTLKYIENSFYSNFKIIFLPVFLLLTVYSVIIYLNYKNLNQKILGS